MDEMPRGNLGNDLRIKKPVYSGLRGAGRVYIYYSFLLACVLRGAGISGAGAIASAFFVRVNLSPFVWG